MKTTLITLNGQQTEKQILTNCKDFFGNPIKGKFIKIGSALCNLKELNENYNNNADKWLKEKLV